MKKVFFAMAALALLGFSSCKKDYTCTCTGGAPSADLGKVSKSDAEDACSTYETGIQGAYPGASCDI